MTEKEFRQRLELEFRYRIRYTLTYERIARKYSEQEKGVAKELIESEARSGADWIIRYLKESGLTIEFDPDTLEEDSEVREP